MADMTELALAPDRRRRWMKRIGTMGFCFFFFKGLAWLAVPVLFWLGLME